MEVAEDYLALGGSSGHQTDPVSSIAQWYTKQRAFSIG